MTVTEPGWQGARTAAIAAGCSSVSDLLEKLGRGELAIVTSDAIQLDPSVSAQQPAAPVSQPVLQPALPVPQHVHYHVVADTHKQAQSAAEEEVGEDDEGGGRDRCHSL